MKLNIYWVKYSYRGFCGETFVKSSCESLARQRVEDSIRILFGGNCVDKAETYANPQGVYAIEKVKLCEMICLYDTLNVKCSLCGKTELVTNMKRTSRPRCLHCDALILKYIREIEKKEI